MLDTSTKKRIDDCRDILVGKLPDPKAQIEQITIGLIYKFMDDMDKEAIELGGTAKFFSGDYEKYSWDNLFDTKVTATEMLSLYLKAIESMDKNPSIPQLFRNIFNNAYLPYRDPETLKLFLKTIGKFEYTHSEKLGDAFEYLLSVMGSQGDAGQFRTPRHIIDFMVEIVDPGKNDTILDPACGTAGFLISAFKHIKGKNKKGLTPDQHKKLIQNFVGYDISPDMVRLSLVNLYLHGFSDPHIHEYDTLSSEKRWDEGYDVILANPPFMSPKGGIRPHKKFTISSNRSEVLFVDYIAEHLNPKGKAGVIVPEGVIFQSGTAYKGLRRMLVENYLYAVVSLPAGVFNPYSGVKTTILLMDKEVAKKCNEILFVKIENDGYNLGAQRMAIKGSQLKEASELTHEFLRTGECKKTTIAHAVPRTVIAENGEYNLGGERYKITVQRASSYPLHEIGSVCDLVNGRAFKPSDWETAEKGGLPIIRIQNLNNQNAKFNYYSGEIAEKYIVEPEDLLFSWSGSKGTSFGAHIWYGGKAVLNQHIFNVYFDKEKALKNFMYYVLNQVVEEVEQNLHGGVGLVHITKRNLEKIRIPLPPLSIQEEIVAEIKGYQIIIDGAKAVVDNYKPKIDIDPEWEIVELGEFVTFNQTGLVKNKAGQNDENEFFYIKMDGITFDGQLILDKLVKVNATKDEFEKYCLKKDDFLYNTRNTPSLVGKSTVFDKEDDKYLFNNNIMRIRFNEKLNPYFANFIINSDSYKCQIRSFVDGTTSVAALYPKNYFSIKIPAPEIETQNQIVVQIKNEQALVNANKQLIEIFEQKIKDRIAKVWGE
jgi:type I restriction enzyme M protein